MSTKGIRISDLKEDKCISLSELLENFLSGDQLNWALLWFDVTPKEKEGRQLSELQKIVQESNEGLPFTFESLTQLSRKIFQEIEILIIGCKNKENIHRYKNDQEMYESCDIVIEMIDGGYWEIFSKDPRIIKKLRERFKETKLLESDFEK